jgi:hypothetical protein
MKSIRVLGAIAFMAATTAWAQQNFSGKWVLNVTKSQNIGMMSEMKLVASVKQTSDTLLITNTSVFNGQQQIGETRLDLNGKPVKNKNPMEAEADTVTIWDGDKLVTTWTSPGSVAGSTSVRTETRSLSTDGKVMTVESSRAKRPSMVMVYDRQ